MTRLLYVLAVAAISSLSAFAGDGTPANPNPSLGQILNRDGSVKTGFQGNFDARGYRMRYDENGAPRFTPTGIGDNYWENGFGYGRLNGDVNAIYVSGSDVYVGGAFTDAGGIPEADYVAKWNGSQWSALGAGTDMYVEAIAVVGSNVYVGGRFQNARQADGSSVSGTGGIARWDGTQWNAMGYGTNLSVHALAVSGTDLLVGGNFDFCMSAANTPVTGTNTIAKWNGTTWSSFNNANLDGEIWCITVAGTSTYIGGSFVNAGGVSGATWLARWNGTAWSGLGSGVNSSVYAIAVSGANVYVGGNFTAAGGVANTARIARWTGSAWTALGGGINPNNYPLVKTIFISGTDVYVGGSFMNVKSNATTDVYNTAGVARWNGTAWSALQRGVYGVVNTIVQYGTSILMGGNFTAADASGNYVSNSLNMVAWNGTAWTNAGMFQPGQNGLNGEVLAVAVSGSDVYVGGNFTDAGGLAAADYLARWNGSTWSAVGAGNVNSTVNAIAVSGTDVYIGGNFNSINGLTANGIARWNGSTWSAMGTGISGQVYALAVSGSTVYVGGILYSAGGVSVNHIARWNGSTWSAMGTGTNSYVFALAVNGSTVYAGGDFTTAGGVAAQRIARWDGSTWSPVGTANSGVDGIVRAIAVSGSDVYVGGNFYTVYNNNAGQSAYKIAKWNGSAWERIMADISIGDVHSLAANGSKLFVGSNSEAGRSVLMWNGTDGVMLGTGLRNPYSYNTAVYALAVTDGKVYAGGNFTGTFDGQKSISRFGMFNDFTATVSTAAPTGIGAIAATLGGNVLSDGGKAVTEKGVVWSVNNAKPDTTHNRVLMGSGTGSFLQLTSPLPPNNIVFVRAYAKNEAGLVYGPQVLFTTATINAPAITAISPASGPVGSTVTITGTNFHPSATENVVYFGATRASVTAATATELQVTVPACASYQTISVLNKENGATGFSRKPFTVVFPAAKEVAPEAFEGAFTLNLSGATSVKSGDLDGDNKPELIVTSNGKLSIYRNTSSKGVINAASFADPVEVLLPGINPTQLVLADLDGDGKLDLAFFQSNYRLGLLRNNSTTGTISFQNRVELNTPSTLVTLAAADLNNDGKPELVSTYSHSYCYYGCSYYGYVVVYRNTSVPGVLNTESFAGYINLTSVYGINAITAGDLDGDGKTDLAASVVNGQGGQQLLVLRNTTVTNSNAFTLQWVQYNLPSSVYRLALADMDGDDKLDIVTTSTQLQVYRNQHTSGNFVSASFAAPVTVGAISGTAFSINDINGDGKPDVGIGSNPLTLFKNNSTAGAFTSSSMSAAIPFSPAGNDILIADINSDASPEIIYASGSGIGILTNTMYVLPLKLLHFTGRLQASDAVMQWQTSSETNTAYFGVERSTDGRTFEQAGHVPAAGNTANGRSYAFTDYGIGTGKKGVLYYRLKMVNKDNGYAYSPVVPLRLAGSNSAVSLYPNPAREAVSLLVSVPATEKVTITLSDYTGRKLQVETITLQAGTNWYNLATDHLAPGTYLVQVAGTTVQETKQLLKQ